MLKKLLQHGESDTLEYKTAFGKAAVETIAAFVNSKGGKLVIGVNNKRKVVGVSVSDESVQQWINQIKSVTNPSIIPDVDVTKYQGKDVVVMWVPAYPVKPVSLIF